MKILSLQHFFYLAVSTAYWKWCTVPSCQYFIPNPHFTLHPHLALLGEDCHLTYLVQTRHRGQANAHTYTHTHANIQGRIPTQRQCWFRHSLSNTGQQDTLKVDQQHTHRLTDKAIHVLWEALSLLEDAQQWLHRHPVIGETKGWQSRGFAKHVPKRIHFLLWRTCFSNHTSPQANNIFRP